MKSMSRYVSGCVIAAALSLIPFTVRASGEIERAISGCDSLAAQAMQISKLAVRSSRYSLDMLGIIGMECNCTFTSDEDGQMWLFQAEPVIRDVDRDGPSRNKLKNGDVIVAIDGMLITTRKAGIRFANLVAGEQVELTVRRRGRTRSVTIVPREIEGTEVPVDLVVHSDDHENTITIEPLSSLAPELALSIEKLARSSVELGKLIDIRGLPYEPMSRELPEFGIDFTENAPRGWIGIGLWFKGGIRKREGDEPAEWRFDDPPSIRSIQPGSPADEAGLRVDDVLLEIDGLQLDSRKGGDRFSRMEPGQIVEWKVRRGGESFTVETRAGVRPRTERAEAQPVPLDAGEPQQLRYSGTLGGTEIEVRGGEVVRVEVDEETGEIVIRSSDSVVRLKLKDKR